MEKNYFFKSKVSLYKDIMQRHLLANGVAYNSGQNEYFYTVNDIPYRLTIKDEVITIECMVASKVEHYVFPVNRPDILMEHYGFSSKSVDQTEVTHTRVTSEDETLFLTTAGMRFDSSEEKGSCANKIVFFSRELIGDGLYELVNRVRFIDSAVPIGAIQDIPRKTTADSALDDIAKLEAEIKKDLRQEYTR